MAPGEGDFLPPINSLPPRPSTMPPLEQPPSYVDQATNGADPEPPTAPAARGPRRRRTQAEMLQGAAGTATATAAPTGQPLQPPPPAPAMPPIFEPPAEQPPAPLAGTEIPNIPFSLPVPDPTVAPLPVAPPAPPGYAAAQPAVHVQATAPNGNTVQLTEELPAAVFDPEQLAGPRFWVGLGTTVNIGNFENIKYDTGISGIPVDADQEQLFNLTEGVNARATYVMDLLGQRLMQRVAEIRGNRED